MATESMLFKMDGPRVVLTMHRDEKARFVHCHTFDLQAKQTVIKIIPLAEFDALPVASATFSFESEGLEGEGKEE